MVSKEEATDAVAVLLLYCSAYLAERRVKKFTTSRVCGGIVFSQRPVILGYYYKLSSSSSAASAPLRPFLLHHMLAVSHTQTIDKLRNEKYRKMSWPLGRTHGG